MGENERLRMNSKVELSLTLEGPAKQDTSAPIAQGAPGIHLVSYRTGTEALFLTGRSHDSGLPSCQPGR